jgi:hypothetical protein
VGENLLAVMVFSGIQRWISGLGVPYFLILVGICAVYGGVMVLLNGKRLIGALKQVNRTAA